MNNDVREFLASHRFAEETKKKYSRALTLLDPLTNLDQLSAADVLALIDNPAWGNSQRSVTLYAIRKFLRWKFGSGHPALSAKIKRIPPRPQRALDLAQAAQLLASFNTQTAKGSRDLAIAALALDTGLRCSELCHLQLADVDLEHRSLQVIVKGGQWKAAVFSEQTAAIIQSWLAWRKPADGIGNLFVSIRPGRPLTREGLQCIVAKWGESLDIKLSPHDLRRSFATLATLYGAPSRTVQLAGRWSSITLVERYTQTLNQRSIEPYLPVKNLLKF